MATVKNTALHAVSLPTGRVLKPGGIASGVSLAEVAGLIDSGLLCELKPVKKQKSDNSKPGSEPEQKEN